MATLGPVAKALGVTSAWLEGEGPDDYEQITEAERRREEFVAIYDSLDPVRKAVAEKQIAALKPEESLPPRPAGPKKARERSR